MRTAKRYFIAPDGRLYYTHKDNGQLVNKLYIPHALREEAIRKAHDDPIAGHCSAIYSLKRLRNYYWKHINQDVRHYILGCQTCQKIKQRKAKPYGLMEKPDSGSGTGELFEHVIADHWGPIQQGTKKYWILALIDTYSRFVMLRVVKSVSTEATIQVIKEWTRTYQNFKILQTDNHGSFTSDQMKRFAKEQGFQLRNSLVRRPQVQGMIERKNSELKKYFGLYKQNDKNDLNEITAMAQKHMNTNYNKSIKNVPENIVFGKTGYNTDPNTQQIPLSRERSEEIEEARKDVATNAEDSYQQRATIYNKNRQNLDIKTGDLVWVNRKYTHAETPNKWEPQFHGPYRVTQAKPPNHAVLQYQNGSHPHLRTFHASQLKPFIPRDPIPTDEQRYVNTKKKQNK